MELPAGRGNVLDVWWDTGTSVCLDLVTKYGDRHRVELEIEEAVALRDWLVVTTTTGRMDAPEVAEAYAATMRAAAERREAEQRAWYEAVGASVEVVVSADADDAYSVVCPACGDPAPAGAWVADDLRGPHATRELADRALLVHLANVHDVSLGDKEG